MSDKQDADKNETLLPHLLNPHKIKVKMEADNKIRYKGLFSLRNIKKEADSI